MSAILVVEDDDDLRFLYEQALARSPHQVTSARRASEGMLHLTNEDFDLLILDLNLPDLPGLRVLEFMQSDVRLRALPVIVISANDRWRPEAEALGVFHFVVKPVSIQHFLDLVDEALTGQPGA